MATKKIDAVSEEVAALVPDPEILTLSTGLEVRVERLRTRGMFKLLKIVTRGAGPILMQMPLDFDDSEAFTQQLLAVVVMAVPEAENEAIEFIQAMVTPSGLIEKPKTDNQRESNKALMEQLVSDLDDPEIDDTISIIEAVIRNEAHDIQALGKRLGSILKVQLPSLSDPAKN